MLWRVQGPFLIVNLLGPILGSVVKSGLGSGNKAVTDEHLGRANAALRMGKWYEFANEYHWLDNYLRKNGNQLLEGALLKSRGTANKITSAHLDKCIDAYTLELPWHKNYTICKDDYNKTLATLTETFRTTYKLSKEAILDALSLERRKCQDFRPDDVKLLRVLKEIATTIPSIKDDPKRTEAISSLEELLNEIVKYPTVSDSAGYFEMRSELDLLKGDQLQAVKTLSKGLSIHKANLTLMNRLAEIVTTGVPFEFVKVIETELAKLGLDSSCHCKWLEKFSSLATWDEASAGTGRIVKECSCGESLKDDVAILLRAFFATGGFKFDSADKWLAGLPVEPKARSLLVNVLKFKEQLSRIISGKIDQLLKTDGVSFETLQNAVRDTLKSAYVDKAEKTKQTLEAKAKREELELIKSKQVEEELRQREEAAKLAGAASIQQDQKLSASFKKFETKGQFRDEKAASQALEKLNQLLASKDYHGACPSYSEYDWREDYVETRHKQAEVGEALRSTGPPIDTGVLCYCESNDYAKAKNTRRLYKAERIERLWGVSPEKEIGEASLLEPIRIAGLNDIRNDCEQFKEVAQSLSSALLWDQAVQMLTSHCRVIRVDDYGDLLGAFSMGLRERLPQNRIGKVLSALNFVKSHWKDTMDESTEWKRSSRWTSAVLSFKKVLDEYVGNSKRPVGTLEEAKGILSKLGDLKTASANVLLGVLEGLRVQELMQMPPIIDAFFDLKFREKMQQKAAWGNRANIYLHYFKKAGELYQALIMLEEAFRCRSRRNDHNDLLVVRSNIDNAIASELEQLQKKDANLEKFVNSVQGYLNSHGQAPISKVGPLSTAEPSPDLPNPIKAYPAEKGKTHPPSITLAHKEAKFEAPLKKTHETQSPPQVQPKPWESPMEKSPGGKYETTRKPGSGAQTQTNPRPKAAEQLHVPPSKIEWVPKSGLDVMDFLVSVYTSLIEDHQRQWETSEG